MDDEVVRAREVLDRIGADLERAIPPDWSPGLLRDEDEQPKLKDHPALAYLHGHWELGQVLRSLPTRASWARPKQALRALFARLLVSCLSPYLHEEQELVSAMVQHHDALASRIDSLEARRRADLEALEAELVELVGRLRHQLERLDGQIRATQGGHQG
ncbi:MAG TPA: hypothetical protein VKY15_04365 [Acidimicrobiales bacterium]|nr:hypothetical protein [Acidimicrobiales bacterium]